jgi:tetratricopeptide (TPR) repeat protein
MELSVDQILQKGIAAHNQGNLEDAERFYRDVLRFHPAHPDANHNLGVLAYSSNEVKAALVFFNAALKSDPTVEQFWVSYINVLIAERYIDDAKLALRRAESKEVSEDKLNSLSQKLDLAEAEKVSSSTPSVIQKQALISLFQNEKHDKTEKLAISLTQKFPEDPLAWKVLGAVLGAGNKFAEGLIATRNAISLNKKDPLII